MEERPQKNWIKTIESDGMGYYLYLPAALHNDFDYGFVAGIDSLYPEGIAEKFAFTKSRRNYTKYYCGVAVLNAPFFIGATLFATFFGYPIDGFSLPFQFSVFLAALAYFLASLWLINSVFIYFKISSRASFLSLIGIVFATNAINYVWKEPSFSHAYEFFLVSLLLFLFVKLRNDLRSKWLYLIGLTLGLILITRPTTILAGLSVFLFFNDKTCLGAMLRFAFYDFKRFLVSLSLVLIPIGIQLLFYLLQTGEPFIYSYGEEGFSFDKPEILNFLFSFRKGWFLYTPFFLFMVPGLLIWFKSSLSRLFGFMLFLTITVWVLSSWWCWYYGGSFGMRAMIDFYPICIIPIGIALNRIRNNALFVFASVIIFLFSGLNLIQNYQYYAQIIHYSSMDKDKYLQVFANPSQELKYITTPKGDPFKGYKIIDSTNYYLGNNSKNGWNCIDHNGVFENDENFALPIELITKESPYSCGVRFQLSDLKHRDKKLVITVKSCLKADTKTSSALCVVSTGCLKNRWFGEVVSSSVRKKETWTTSKLVFDLKSIHPDEEEVACYFYNPSSSKLLVSGMRVSVYYCTDKN